jgi:hypothetical protein
MSRGAASRAALALIAIAVLAGCAQTAQPLYSWETYPRQQYVFLLREGVSPDQQIKEIEAHAEKARAANLALPPGLRAHLGMLYLSVGNPGRAAEMWNAEKTAFPESAPYMDQLLQRLAGGAKQPLAPSANQPATSPATSPKTTTPAKPGEKAGEKPA